MSKSKRKDNGGATPPSSAEPSRDQVAARAYELYIERGAGDGRELDDWLTAEREVRGRETPPKQSRGTE